MGKDENNSMSIATISPNEPTIATKKVSCICKEDGLFPKGSCKASYCQCNHGVGALQSCVEGTFFHPDYRICAFSRDILGCGASPFIWFNWNQISSKVLFKYTFTQYLCKGPKTLQPWIWSQTGSCLGISQTLQAMFLMSIVVGFEIFIIQPLVLWLNCPSRQLTPFYLCLCIFVPLNLADTCL